MRIQAIKIYFITMFMVVFGFTLVFAGNTGKISGRVTDAQSGQPLPGCNILVEGTYYGAATDVDGNYFILNIPPGTYTLRFMMIGYGQLRITDIKVKVDFTTDVDASMTVEALQAGEVTVVAERPMIQKDLTSSASVVGSEEMESLPVTEVGDVLGLQAGYVDGSLRGGRKGEVMYMVDGVPMTDSYDRSATVDVSTSMVQELQVISGAFNAEYGRAMSGIVNITTKQGSDHFGGHFEIYSGDHVSSHNEIFPRVNHIKPLSIRNFEAGIHGPIISNKLYYYINARHIYYDGYHKGQIRYVPTAYAEADGDGNVALLDSSNMLGSGEWVDMGWNRKNYLQGQLIWRISNKSKISYNGILDAKIYQDYDRNFMYNPLGLGTNELIGQTHVLKYQNQLSQKSFFDLAYSYGNRHHDFYYGDKDLTSDDSTMLVHPDFQSTFAYQFKIGGTQNNRYIRDSGYHLGKVTFTSQVTRRHQIKTGLEVKYNDLSWQSWTYRPAPDEESFNWQDPYIHPTQLADSTIYSDSFEGNPLEFSGYIQDKMEYKNFIVNIGIRFDYFDSDYYVLSDPSDPNIYNPIKPENRFNDINGNEIQDPGEESLSVEDRMAYWYTDATPKMAVSPRLGLSFPISDRGVFHFSYGHFFQTPSFNLLYTNPNFELGSGTGHQGTIGNADMRPEKTIVGEIGVQQQITDRLSGDLTVYLKDVRDLTGTRAEVIEVYGGSKNYSRIVNSDFGVIKGVTLSLNDREPGGFYMGADYTFQIAEGTASDPYAYMNAIASGSDPEVQLTSLAWDQRHTVNIVMGYTQSIYGFNATANYGSGLPYTPRTSEDITSILLNSESKPATFNVNVKGYYKLSLGSLRSKIFIRVTNLFDRLNEVNVYDDTGTAGFTGDQERVESLNLATPVNSIEELFNSPTNYSEPRRIEIGLRVNL